MDASFSNSQETQHSCLPSQAPISMEFHPPSIPYFPLGSSQDIKNLKLASRASSPILIKEEEEWQVSHILDSKITRGKLWTQFFKSLDIYGACWGEELLKVGPTPGTHI
ncbi:hypothetical protein O181_058492 [Austropuccinia psidii MF-1]|uniref:Uncharacterized protein n=1 Tax=Austropuccinia psidii MF-1 TaxID=1389203 RepID=A0A9Q3EJV8_9BASI|nr:hypothetical protein [Austropuccinia psidii MF-1]